MRSLYDVNLLIAMFDPHHLHHDRALAWHSQNGHSGWATCPITQNGLMRIMSQAKYPNCKPIVEMMGAVAAFALDPHHTFWPDDLSLASAGVLHAKATMTSGMLTDLYLLALAVKHSGRLVTLDKHISQSVVIGATAAHIVVL